MSSGFITESEILEARRLRQEEWEKVRSEDQPKVALEDVFKLMEWKGRGININSEHLSHLLFADDIVVLVESLEELCIMLSDLNRTTEAPEETYDPRPLYARLEEQKMRKDAEYEEAHKLKNMIRGLDDDEVGFLDLVERTKAEVAQQISMEEKKEMQEFRERVSNLAESEEMIRLRAQLAPARSTPVTNQSQKSKLAGVVVRKRKASEVENEKENDATPAKTTAESSAVLRCVGVLPGLGHYDTDTSSDTDDSSDNDINIRCSKRDLLGRKSDSDHKKKEDGKS